MGTIRIRLLCLVLLYFIAVDEVSSQAGPPPPLPPVTGPPGPGGTRQGGRKLRVPGGYEVQFGSWPIMEITKLQRKPRHPKPAPIEGFMQNAIQNQPKVPPGLKLLSRLRPRNRNKPKVPHGPQVFAELKPGNLPAINGQQPIIIRAPTPLNFQSATTTTTTTTTTTERPIPFSSIMQNVAYSVPFRSNRYDPVHAFPPGPPPFFGHGHRGFRGNHYHHHHPPPWRPGPVFFSPPQQIPHQPILITGEPAQAPSERFELSVSKVPQVPPMLKIGSHPPSGYAMTHGEQQLITLKLPDVKMGGKMDVASLLKGADYKHTYDLGSPFGSNRRQGSAGSRKEDKKLPDVGAIYTVNMVLQTPNISAPVNGSLNPNFQQGMEDMYRTYGNLKDKQTPLDSQVKLLGKLFTELQQLKPVKVRVDDHFQNGVIYQRDGKDPFGEPAKKLYGPPKIDAPLLAVHIQSYSLPEPGTADPDILESAKMFGLQGHKIEFGTTNEIINLMDTAQKAVTSRVSIDELGYTRGEINRNLEDWIKSYVSLTRKIKDQAHAKGESMANSSFRQHQHHMKMPDDSMQPMDPKVFSQGASITNAGVVATFQG